MTLAGTDEQQSRRIAAILAIPWRLPQRRAFLEALARHLFAGVGRPCRIDIGCVGKGQEIAAEVRPVAGREQVSG